jgi:hypothetical protein
MRSRGLKIVVYNPLSAKAPWRLLQIAVTLAADVVLVPGTTCRTIDSQPHTWARLNDDYWVTHFGWAPGGLTNKSAGCAIIISCKLFSTRDVARVFLPPTALLGRGGGLRLGTSCFDMTIVCIYAPPRGTTKKQQAISDKAGVQINKWAQDLATTAPARSLMLIGGDFNAGFGLDKHENKWQRGIGDYNLRKAAPSTAIWEEWMMFGDLVSLTTVCDKRLVSFFPKHGRPSLPDGLLAPSNCGQCCDLSGLARG